MNKSMMHKWNQTVRAQDRVFFLGDFAWRNIGYYITHLNGKKTFITGNHDERLRHTQDQVVIEYGGHSFLLIHRPQTGLPDGTVGPSMDMFIGTLHSSIV